MFWASYNSGIMVRFSVRRFSAVLREYCQNSSISGLSYLSDMRYHYTERFYWLLCLFLCTCGAYHFIDDALDEFQTDTISMVVESLQPHDRTAFPSIAICEMGYSKEEYDYLEEYSENITANSKDDDNYGDVLDFLMRIVFFNLYTTNTMIAYCKKYEDMDGVGPCPKDDYIEFSRKASVKCEDFMYECTWMEKPFNCCQYFRPLPSTYGPCYALNNIQATTENGPHWLDTWMDSSTGPGQINVKLRRSARICVLNEEQAPNLLFGRLHFELRNTKMHLQIRLSLQTVENDPGIRALAPAERNCKFRDEAPQSRYPYYSFVTCIAECIKQAQLRTCGCAYLYMKVDDRPDDVAVKRCNYTGMICLDTNELIFPRATILQPWNGYFQDQCTCYPSCTDNEIKEVTNYYERSDTREFTIRLIGLPTQRYRRQRNKDSLDFVVAIGGIVGLFLGASILSLVEFIYFFTVRLLGTAWMKRNRR